MTTTRAAIYTRVSLDRNGDSESPERQEAACRSVAAQRGWEVVEVYSDRDASAFSPRAARPRFDRLLRDLDHGLIDVVVVWKLDRLTRGGLAGITPIIELLNRVGAQLVSVTETIDTTTPMGEAMVGVLASMAKQESANTSLRVRTAHASRASSGKMHGGGSRQYGYRQRRKVQIGDESVRYVVVPDEDGPPGSVVEAERKIVHEAMERVLAGESLRSIARDLNERGVPTTTAGERRKLRPNQKLPEGVELGEDGRYELRGEWRSVTLGQMLRSPTLAAKRILDGKLIDGEWEPIITPEEREQVLLALARPLAQRRDVQGERRSHLLSGAGVIRCGKCGSAMRRMTMMLSNGKPFHRYQCLRQPGQPQCGRVAVTQASADDHVVGELLDFLTYAEIRPLEGDHDEDEVESMLAEAQAALSDLVQERFVRRRLSADEYEAARVPLEIEVSDLDARLAAIRRRRGERSLEIPLGDREALGAWWEEASPAERVAAVREAVVSVTVLPAKHRGGNRFDPKRLVIEWNSDTFRRTEEGRDLEDFTEWETFKRSEEGRRALEKLLAEPEGQSLDSRSVTP